jgi:hypothetical protein
MSFHTDFHLEPADKLVGEANAYDGKNIREDYGPYASLKLYVWHGMPVGHLQATFYTGNPEHLDLIAAEATKAAAALRQLIAPAPAAPESAPCPVCSRELMPGEPCHTCEISRVEANTLDANGRHWHRDGQQAAVMPPGSPIDPAQAEGRARRTIARPDADLPPLTRGDWDAAMRHEDSPAKLSEDLKRYYPDTSADM